MRKRLGYHDLAAFHAVCALPALLLWALTPPIYRSARLDALIHFPFARAPRLADSHGAGAR